MRRVRSLVVAGAAIAALSLAGASTAAASPHASGGGKWGEGLCNFGFGANLTPAGKATGFMTLTKCFGSFQFLAKVTCLRVEGNEATIGGVVTKSNNPANPVGSGIVFYAQDNGEPGANRDEFFAHGQLTVPETCPAPADTIPPTNGNIEIHE